MTGTDDMIDRIDREVEEYVTWAGSGDAADSSAVDSRLDDGAVGEFDYYGSDDDEDWNSILWVSYERVFARETARETEGALATLYRQVVREQAQLYTVAMMNIPLEMLIHGRFHYSDHNPYFGRSWDILNGWEGPSPRVTVLDELVDWSGVNMLRTAVRFPVQRPWEKSRPLQDLSVLHSKAPSPCQHYRLRTWPGDPYGHTLDGPGFTLHDTVLAERIEEMTREQSVPWERRDDRRHHNPRRLR